MYISSRPQWVNEVAHAVYMDPKDIYKNQTLHKTRYMWALNSSPPPPGKMAAVLADDIFKCIFLNENYRIQINGISNAYDKAFQNFS